MKITHLLAQYLYKNKRLDLQGIGSFLLNQSIIIEPEINKQSKENGIEGITFENNTSVSEDPELIAFISKYAGKIKALASADLDSHLELAKQFLNIGKPFLFEGIGSLTKIRSGEYAFEPGLVLNEKLSEKKVVDSRTTSTNEEPVSDYKSTLYKNTSTSNWKKPLVFTFVIIGIALAIWGGYTIYKNNSSENTLINKSESTNEKTILLEDSSTIEKDSIPAQINSIKSNDNGGTKFVLEVANKERTLQRFSQLKTFQWDVKMETADSITFKLFILFPINITDSTRILDSLSALTGKRVYIEK